MSEATRRSLSTNRKKRGVVRASITKLRSRVEELELVSSPDTADQAKRLRGHIQTICEKINVIMTLTPHPPLSVIQKNHLYEGRKASKLYSPQGLNPCTTKSRIFLLISCLDIARSANSANSK